MRASLSCTCKQEQESSVTEASSGKLRFTRQTLETVQYPFPCLAVLASVTSLQQVSSLAVVAVQGRDMCVCGDRCLLGRVEACQTKVLRAISEHVGTWSCLVCRF